MTARCLMCLQETEQQLIYCGPHSSGEYAVPLCRVCASALLAPLRAMFDVRVLRSELRGSYDVGRRRSCRDGA